MNTSLPLRAIAAHVCVAPQLTPDSMAEAARVGFLSVINNRPDFEAGPDQPTSAQIEAAATAAGLVYHHLPIGPATQSLADIEQMAQLLVDLPRPLLMFCRSGNRSERLYHLAQGT
jgi:uncharacterized protein (TIGR01244 family)